MIIVFAFQTLLLSTAQASSAQASVTLKQHDVIHVSLLDAALLIARDRSLSHSRRIRKLKRVWEKTDAAHRAAIASHASAAIDHFEYMEIVVFYLLVLGDAEVSVWMDDMEREYSRIVANGWATPDVARLMYKVHLARLDVESANRLAHEAMDPEMPPVSFTSNPVPLPKGQRGFVSLDGDALRSWPFDAQADTAIVVVAGCGVAERAMVGFREDDGLRTAFAAAGVIWAVPASAGLDLTAIQDWNAGHPGQPLVVFDRNSHWSDIDFSTVPTFHFFRKGRLVHTARGWPTDGMPPVEIIKGLKRIGIRLE